MVHTQLQLPSLYEHILPTTAAAIVYSVQTLYKWIQQWGVYAGGLQLHWASHIFIHTEHLLHINQLRTWLHFLVQEILSLLPLRRWVFRDQLQICKLLVDMWTGMSHVFPHSPSTSNSGLGIWCEWYRTTEFFVLFTLLYQLYSSQLDCTPDCCRMLQKESLAGESGSIVCYL